MLIVKFNISFVIPCSLFFLFFFFIYSIDIANYFLNLW